MIFRPGHAKIPIAVLACAFLLGVGYVVYEIKTPDDTAGTEQVLLGVFKGTLPCADCAGIETELTLIKTDIIRGDGPYILKRTYVGRSAQSFVEEGEWTTERGTNYDRDAVVYALYDSQDPDATAVARYVKVDESSIRLITLGGDAIDSKLPYELYKQAASLEQQAEKVLMALKNKDGEALASFAHPTKGVRFSPYGHISISNDIRLLPSEIEEAFTSIEKRTWGAYDGSGEPITLTFSDYAQRFVYDQDFLNAPQKATDEILGTGNTLINIAEVYPSATFIEYHFPGFDPQYSGIDWKSLRLVFEKMDTGWYLVGIIHDQWTI